jgi:hypothetical protein
MKKLIKPIEAVIILIIAAIAVLLIFLPKGNPDTAVITWEKSGALEIAEIPLYTDREVTLSELFGDKNAPEMSFLVTDGDICVKGSDCGGKDCVRAGFAKQHGGVIICAPNRVTVRLEVTHENSPRFDARI